MRRNLVTLGLVLCVTSLAACSSKTSSGTDDCPAGEVRVDGVCRTLCVSNRDCGASEVCRPDSVCAVGSGQAPRIFGIDGDGSPDGTTDAAGQHTSHHFFSGLVIDGQNLADVVVSLEGIDAGLTSYANLVVRPGATDTRVEVDLPGALQGGNYMLVVTNAAGADQAGTYILQGEPGGAGQNGTCDPMACTTQTFPGAGNVTTLVMTGSNAVTGNPLSLRIDGVEQVPSSTPTNSVWLGVMDRSTHALSTDAYHNRAYDIDTGSDVNQLVIQLDGLADTQMVIMVSKGLVSSEMNTAYAGSSLAAELVERGAGDLLGAVGAGEAFVFVGYAGIGQSNGALVVSSTGLVEATSVIVDGMIAGPPSNDRLGASVSSSEIDDGTIVGSDMAATVAGAGLTHSATGLAVDTSWLGNQSCAWYPSATGYVNSMDAVLNFTCPANAYMSGAYSYHSNGTEDRRWRFRCCQLYP